MTADSLFKAGMRYYKGPAVVDIPQAKLNFVAAARSGNTRAMAALGELFDDSTVAGRNADSAIYWYKAAVGRGYGPASYQLGKIYQKGRPGLAQDLVRSAAWFQQGMSMGNEASRNMVAYYFYKGIVQRQDYDSAFLLYKQVVRTAKLPNAMYFLGLCYRNGYGTARNADSARYWLVKAASLKEEQAQYELSQPQPDNPVKVLSLPSSIQQQQSTVARVRTASSRSLPGVYTGYAIRYDWSGNHITSILPVQVVLNKDGDIVSGNWVEGNITAALHADYAGTDLHFHDSKYFQKGHYTLGAPEPWEFQDAALQVTRMQDSIYLTGNLQLYSPVRLESGPPMFINLARAATAGDDYPAVADNGGVTISPNPFHDHIQVQFALAASQRVYISLLSLGGERLTTEDAGTYPAGSYTHSINVPASIASGEYIVSVNTGEFTKHNVVVIKQ